MIADLKPYPEYMDSGLPWVGQMPSHWSQRRMKFLFTERTEKGFPSEPLLAATQTKGVVRKEDYGTRTVTATKDFHLLKLVESGDFVISLRSFEGGIEISHCRGIISPAYTVLKPTTDAQPAYYSRFFKSRGFIASLNLFVTGIREGQNIDYVRLSRAYMPLPPAEDQGAIGRFLDWANGRIDRTIRAKKRVIALLNEQKQAIIHHAVTRGLDPAAALKPSGIPLLGNIPEHWKTPLFGRLLKGIEQGWSPVGAEGELSEKQWAVLTLSSVRRGKFNPLAIKPVSLKAAIPTGIQVRNGDILLTRSNTRDRVGDVCVVHQIRHRTILCDLIYRLRIREDVICAQFLVFELLSRIGRNQIEQDARGSSGTMPKIAQRHIKSWRILLPPLDEQRRIVQRIETESAPLNIAISRLEREIEFLREYRTRLFADVVTGKLDVRQAVAAIREEDLGADNVGTGDSVEAEEEGEEFAAEELAN